MPGERHRNFSPYRLSEPEPGAGIQIEPDTTRFTGLNTLSKRFELQWIAGQRGKPGLNADIQNAAEATRMVADPDFEVLGTNATSALSAFAADGGISFTTAGADNDQMILVPHLDRNQSAWQSVNWPTNKEVIWECDIATGAAITTAIVWAGLKLTNTSTVATDDDQVFLRYQSGVNSGKWQVISSIGGVDTTTNSTVTVAVSTTYHVKIVVDSARKATVYLNGTPLYTTTALTNSVNLKPYIGVQASGAAAARSIVIYGAAISRIKG